MKIENKIANYEINRHIAKYSQNIGENRQFQDGQKNQEINKESRDAIVNLSPASREYKLAVDVITAAPDVREDKIAEIRNKIESGRYEIDNLAVAGKVLDDFMNELL